MRMFKTLVVIGAVVLLSGPIVAPANLIWDWTGDCNGNVTPGHGGGPISCAGQAHFHAVTTDAYIPGESFPGDAFPTIPVQDALATLLEARYTDENLTFDFLEDGGVFWLRNAIGFLLPTVPTGPGGVNMEDFGFRTDSAGNWLFNGANIRPGCDLSIDFCSYGARGFNGVWTRVPEPSTFVLLGVGLASLASLRRRKVG
jgi:PEP-CTERM motif